MTDLRVALIEAAAEAIRVERERGKTKAEFDRRDTTHATLALDAVLDVLADRADEWWVEAAEGRAVDCRVEHWVHEPEGLIAVLRGDTE